MRRRKEFVWAAFAIGALAVYSSERDPRRIESARSAVAGNESEKDSVRVDRGARRSDRRPASRETARTTPPKPREPSSRRTTAASNEDWAEFDEQISRVSWNDLETATMNALIPVYGDAVTVFRKLCALNRISPPPNPAKRKAARDRYLAALPKDSAAFSRLIATVATSGDDRPESAGMRATAFQEASGETPYADELRKEAELELATAIGSTAADDENQAEAAVAAYFYLLNHGDPKTSEELAVWMDSATRGNSAFGLLYRKKLEDRELAGKE